MNLFSSAVEPARRRTAFTLVELLVSMVVGVLLIVFLFQLFNATAGAWRSGEEQADTFREARAALQLMVRDISSAAAPMTRNAYAAPTPVPSSTPASTLTPVMVIDHYPGTVPAPSSEDLLTNEEFYCLTNIPNNGISSLSAVGYFCVWMPDMVSASNPQAATTTSAPSAYALIRQYLGSGRPAVAADPTKGTTARDAIPGVFDLFKSANGQPISFADLYKRTVPGVAPGPSEAVAAASELCSYIWDLQFRTSSSPQVYKSGTYDKQLPAYVEIRFKALSASAARQLEGNTAITRTIWSKESIHTSLYQRIIQPGTRQFVARVPVGSGSLTFTP